MERKLTIWILILFSCFATFAQDLTVKSFSLVTNDLAASTHRRSDPSGKACALVKLQLASSEATFEGDIVGSVVYSQSEYSIYMSNGSKKLNVEFEGHPSLEIVFADYGIPSLESLSTYRLVLSLPKDVDSAAQFGQMDVNYTPQGAEIWIDGELKGTSPGHFEGLSIGSHSVEIREDGYQSMAENVIIVGGLITLMNGSLLKSDDSLDGSYTDNTSASSSSVVFTVNGISFKMMYVEGGTFTMGATSEQGSDAKDFEKPTHTVTLSSYFIGETEVTQELWEAVMGNNPSIIRGDKRPVTMVNWSDCQEFVDRLNQLTGRNFRLPTEAEWEYAARGGKKSKGRMYSGSNNVNSVAWNKDNIEGKGSSTTFNGARIVKTKKANELGIYDMSGNVYEWCRDWYGKYVDEPQTNPSGPAHGIYRVLRGGCYATEAVTCRVSSRFSAPYHVNASNIGLRLAL